MMISCHHHNCHHYGYHHCYHHSQLIILTELCLLMMISIIIIITVIVMIIVIVVSSKFQPNYASAFLFGYDHGHQGYHQSSKSISVACYRVAVSSNRTSLPNVVNQVHNRSLRVCIHQASSFYVCNKCTAFACTSKFANLIQCNMP